MKSKLVDQKQVFGFTKDFKELRSTINNVSAIKNKLGSTSEIFNHGANHAPSFENKNPQAYAQASKGCDNPFWPTGHPKKGD